MVDTKTLTSNMCSSVDNPVIVFPQTEPVGDLHRTYDPQNRNNLLEHETENSDPKKCK